VTDWLWFEKDFQYFISNTYIDQQTIVLSLVYIKRLKAKYPAHLENEITSSVARQTLFGALVLAHKTQNEGSFKSVDWAKVSGYSTAEVKNILKKDLRLLEYKTVVCIVEYQEIQYRVLNGFAI
jgi:hypothetical protein